MCAGSRRGLFAFVVHKHKATSLHYDFRLEIGGVMPSWSVPKGPTLEAGVRRLAMPTGDHSLEYSKFEGVIPPGSYGAGPVMIWDEGSYNPEVEIDKGIRREVHDRGVAEELVNRSYIEGNLKFSLYGMKLSGSFALVRTAGFKGKPSWLLIKYRDQHCQEGYDANEHDFSAATNLTLAQIAARGGGMGSAKAMDDTPPASRRTDGRA